VVQQRGDAGGEAFTLGQCDTDTQKTISTLEKRMKN
jgi:hypothetical protein